MCNFEILFVHCTICAGPQPAEHGSLVISGQLSLLLMILGYVSGVGTYRRSIRCEQLQAFNHSVVSYLPDTSRSLALISKRPFSPHNHLPSY